MEKQRIKHILIITLFLILSVGLDQVSKSMVRNSLLLGERISLVDKSFILVRAENKGAFLSLGSDLHPKLNVVVLKIIPSLVLLGFLIWLFFNKSNSVFQLIGFSIVVGGGLANIFDRIVYNSVTDFLYIDLGFFRTGIFNLADVFIMTGAGIILLTSIKKEKLKSANN